MSAGTGPPSEPIRQQAVALVHTFRRRAAGLYQTNDAVTIHGVILRTAQLVKPILATVSILRTAPFSF